MPRKNLRLAQRGLLIICGGGGGWICGLYHVIMNLSIRGLGMIDQGRHGGVRSSRVIEWKERRSWWEGQRGFELSSGVLALVLSYQLHFSIEEE